MKEDINNSHIGRFVMTRSGHVGQITSASGGQAIVTFDSFGHFALVPFDELELYLTDDQKKIAELERRIEAMEKDK